MAKSTILTALNRTGTTLVAGSVVYIVGFDDESKLSTIALADNRDEARMPAIGVVREDIENGAQGVVKVGGPVIGFDTTNANINDDVFVGVNGQITFENPLELDDEDVLSQQLGTVISIEEEPNGQINLFPLEIRRKIKHEELLDVFEDQHHVELHAEQHRPGGRDEFVHAQQHQPGGGDEFIHSSQHAAGGADELSHSDLPDLDSDDHPQYSLVDGTRAFTGTVGGVTPTADAHLATKKYVDDSIIGEEFRSPALDKDLTTPPISPTSGDRYIVAGAGGTATGDWSGQEEKIAQWNGASWDFTIPGEGWVVWIADEDVLYGYTDSHPAGSWVALTVTGGVVGGSGADGQVAFWSGTSTITGEANFYWDDTNDRLGIGTSSPAESLDLSGAIKIGDAVATNDGTIRWTGTDFEGRVSGVWTSLTQGGVDVSGTPVNNQVAIWVDADTIEGDTDLIFDGSRLGIGIGSPAEALDVSGAVRIGNAVATNDGTIRWTGTDFEGRKSGSWVSLTATGSGSPGGTDGAVQFNDSGSFGGDASNFYWDDTNDKLGIGFSPPVADLHVQKTAAGDNVDIRIRNLSSTGSANLSLWGNSSITNLYQRSNSFSGTRDGEDLASAFELIGSFGAPPSKFIIGTRTATSLFLMTDETIALTIDGSQRVGIGTKSPDVELDVLGQLEVESTDYPPAAVKRDTGGTNSNHAGVLRLTAQSTAASIVDGFGAHIDYALGDSGGEQTIGRVGFERDGADNSSKLFVDTSNAGTLTTQFVIDLNGNVGIGTESPGRLTHINATGDDAILRIENSGNGNISAIEFFRERTTGTGVGAAAIRSASDTSTNTGYLEFLVQTSTDAGGADNIFTLIGDGGGNDRSVAIGENFAVPQATKPPQNSLVVESMIGIGLMSPSNALHIEGSGDKVAKIHSTTGDASLDLHNDVNGEYSGITFTRRRLSGSDVTGGVIRMQSDTSTNTAFLEFLVETSVGLTSSGDRAMTLIGDGAGNGQSVAIGNTYATPSGTKPPSNSLVVEGQLGVGIFSPSEKVEVNGGIILGSALGTANGTIQYTGSDFEGRLGGAWVSLTSGSGTDGVPEETFQEHKAQQGEINDHILVALDGYASGQTVSEHYTQHSQAIQDIVSGLDGYVVNQTFEENKSAQQEINRHIIESLDGYGTGTGNIDGSGQDGYLAVFSDEDTILGEPELYFDRDDGYLGVGTTEPNERITADGAISLKEVSEPIAEAGFGKLYVNVKNGRVFFKRENGENLDLTAFDIDGGNFLDTFETTRDFDAGTFTS